jgi:hypothetical protein
MTTQTGDLTIAVMQSDSGVCHQAFFADPDGNALAIPHRYAPPGVAPSAERR